jgi:hypothetical protein
MSNPAPPAATASTPLKIRSAAPGLRSLLAILWCTALGSYLCSSIHSPRFFENLTIGHWIRSHRSVPVEFIWSLAGDGAGWRATSWLFQASLSVLEECLGSDPLIVVKMLSMVCGFLTLYFVLSSRAGDRLFGGFLATVIGCGMFVSNDFTAQLIVWPLLLLSLELVYRCLESSSRSGSTGRSLLGALFIINVLYANLHYSSLVSVLSGVVLLFALPVDSLENKRIRWIAAGILLLSQFVTPYAGAQMINAVGEIWQMSFLEIGHRLNPGTAFHYPVAFVFLLWLVLAVFLHEFPSGLRRIEAFAALVSTLAALGSAEAAPYALIFLGFGLAGLWRRAAEGRMELGNLGEGFRSMGKALGAFPLLGSVFLLLCVCIVNVMNLWRIPYTKTLLPAVEVDYLLEHSLRDPVLHDPFVGSYLVYRFASSRGEPARRVVVSEESKYLNQEFFLGNVAFQGLKPGWENYLSSLAPNTILCRTDSIQYAWLKNDPRWHARVAYGVELPSKNAENLLRRGAYGWIIFTRRTN